MGCPTTNRWEQEIFIIRRSAAYIEYRKGKALFVAQLSYLTIFSLIVAN
jgi:hypothetical protein